MFYLQYICKFLYFLFLPSTFYNSMFCINSGNSEEVSCILTLYCFEIDEDDLKLNDP